MNIYRRHRFPPDINSYAVWLYYCLNLSRRDIEDLRAERGFTVSYEAIRLCYPTKVGALGEALAALMALNLYQVRCHLHAPTEEKAPWVWGRLLYRRSIRRGARPFRSTANNTTCGELWIRSACLAKRFGYGEVVDVSLQAKRDGAAAMRFLRRLVRRSGREPRLIVSDKLRSYPVARPLC